MRALLVAGLAVALCVLAAGCGSGQTETPEPEAVEGTLPQETGQTGETGGGATQPKGDPAAGKEIYAAQGCGSCHVYGPAGSTGTVGPNLDESQATYEEALEQIAEGGGGMPAFKDQLSEQEIADVAAFVTEPDSG